MPLSHTFCLPLVLSVSLFYSLFMSLSLFHSTYIHLFSHAPSLSFWPFSLTLWLSISLSLSLTYSLFFLSLTLHLMKKTRERHETNFSCTAFSFFVSSLCPRFSPPGKKLSRLEQLRMWTTFNLETLCGRATTCPTQTSSSTLFLCFFSQSIESSETKIGSKKIPSRRKAVLFEKKNCLAFLFKCCGSFDS